MYGPGAQERFLGHARRRSSSGGRIGYGSRHTSGKGVRAREPEFLSRAAGGCSVRCDAQRVLQEAGQWLPET